MKTAKKSSDGFYKSIIDAMPSAVFIMDKDGIIIDLNLEANKITGIDPDKAIRRLCGDVLHCIHAIKNEKDCGQTQYCSDCVIRSSINSVMANQKVYREKAVMNIGKSNSFHMAYFLVTSSPVNYQEQHLILISLEDITEITKLGGIIPICSSCKRIRDSHGIWNNTEEFIQKHSEAQFSHSICSDCAKKLYPDIKIYKD